MAPPTNIGASGAIGFDEALNWQHNNAVQEQDTSRRKSLFRKVGITTQRKRANAEDDLPPFVMRQIPYDTWRKHYAKDKDGNYRGTHAPAEDCLLKPEDVQKWRLGDAVTKADQWTRGREALPVYSEVRAEGALPDYQVDNHGTSQSAATNETVLTPGEGRLAEYIDVTETPLQPQRLSSAVPPPQDFSAAVASLEGAVQPRGGSIIADGKTAGEIIREAEAKGKQKLTWKQKFSKGFQNTMGSSTASMG
ncbi:hypothetical protein A1O7_00609 [Cladophialophora yegresii CBS 114405]|uniref:Uncharacterized protein n=1 Tax=Cladophialophora yegresii CBS 114405 TaxID=1182544 RepID=W9W8G9_9EURO|nr:uncharacterized protein A1O7_00609 [Cladophialophora yegresii CBS 114405]EXJ64273.1 hypothetical protein A1O7_00609 [Cladophialophora yegresii CBS 114405]